MQISSSEIKNMGLFGNFLSIYFIQRMEKIPTADATHWTYFAQRNIVAERRLTAEPGH
jgi:hypothetical protein